MNSCSPGPAVVRMVPRRARYTKRLFESPFCINTFADGDSERQLPLQRILCLRNATPYLHAVMPEIRVVAGPDLSFMTLLPFSLPNCNRSLTLKTRAFLLDSWGPQSIL